MHSESGRGLEDTGSWYSEQRIYCQRYLKLLKITLKIYFFRFLLYGVLLSCALTLSQQTSPTEGKKFI